MSHTTITKVQGFEVLDSRGNPTVRVEVTLQSGTIERISEPYIVWGTVFVQTKRHSLP